MFSRSRAPSCASFVATSKWFFQDPYKSLNPRRRILQSITEGPVQHGVPTSRATERAGELMELVGLPKEALDRFPHEFSGGQRQRICIARALAMEPSVIVADEAVSALDVSVQAQVLELLNQLQKQLGFSMIFVTHDLRVASNICNRIAVMRQGRIVEIGPTGDVFGSPQQPYTRELLAAAVFARERYDYVLLLHAWRPVEAPPVCSSHRH